MGVVEGEGTGGVGGGRAGEGCFGEVEFGDVVAICLRDLQLRGRLYTAAVDAYNTKKIYEKAEGYQPANDSHS